MRVLMIEGRPAEHPIHKAYANAVEADFIYVDHFLKYQGRSDNKVIVFLSWLFTAVYLLTKRKYDVYFCGGPCPPLTLLKKVKLLNNKKIISLAANETLFFLNEGKYSEFTKRLYYDWYNKTIDGIICIGSFQEKLAHQLISNKRVIVRKIFNGLPEEFFNNLRAFNYNVKGSDIICIANGPSGFRVYYKGLDLLVKVFESYCAKGYTGNLLIVGDWEATTRKELLQGVVNSVSNRIMFTGKLESYMPLLKNVGLSVHFSRGDSFPTSNLETLALGIPTIVTEITGTSEIIKEINKNWVAPVELDELVQRVEDFFQLSVEEKRTLSNKAKSVMNSYKISNAIESYRQAFQDIYSANK